jgi:hypothetical protein
MGRVTVEFGDPAAVQVHPRRAGWCFRQQAQSFVDLVRGNAAANLSSGEDSLRDYALTEQIWRLELDRAAKSGSSR